MSTTENNKPFALRLPLEMYAKIEAIAEANDRSVNAQIVRFLRSETDEDSYPDIKTLTRDEAAAIVRNNVYAGARLIERLCDAHKMKGHGHHMRQRFAETAIKFVQDNWDGLT